MVPQSGARGLMPRPRLGMGAGPWVFRSMARLRAPGGRPALAEPGSDWPLLDNQRGDGGWGGQMVCYHDRIISPLSGADSP